MNNPINNPLSSETSNDRQLQYDGKTGDIFKIWLLTVLLNIITLGVYSFWGKTRLRSYIVSSFHLRGDRFEYLGKGRELFLGFLKAVCVLAIPTALYIYLAREWQPDIEQDGVTPVMTLVTMIFYAFYGLAFLVAIYSSLRYKMRRLAWRAIRFNMDGSALSYALRYIAGLLVKMLSLGILAPYADMFSIRYITNHMKFGNQRLRHIGDGSQLIGTHLITTLLLIPSLGISRFWYHAALWRYHAENIRLGNRHVKFQMNVQPSDLIGLVFVNYFILIVTLGLGAPIILQRKMEFIQRHLHIVGELSTLDIAQSENISRGSGEGLASLLDVDIGF